VAFTDTTALSQLLQTAFQLRAYKPLRTLPIYEQFIGPDEIKWVSGSDPQPGSTVTFSFVDDLTETPTTIAESTDVTPTALSSSQISVTAQEYGFAVTVTQRLNAVGLVTVSPIAAERIARQMVTWHDNIAKLVVQAGTNVVFAGTATSRATVTTAMNLSSAKVRQIVAKLRGAGAMPVREEKYAGLVHPDSTVDLRAEPSTTNGGWRPVHEYQDKMAIYNGEVGTYEGAVFVESPRAPLFADSGSPATVDVYGSLFLGREAMAQAVGYQRQIVVGPQTDNLRRFFPVGWKSMIGFGVFRQGALWRLESASTIGANT
jgi:N4-gp56 family major capsid protein